MPLTLPQLTRRQFLRRAAVIGTSIAIGSSVFVELARRPYDPNLVIFLSDTHIAGDTSQSHLGVNMTEHLSSVVREILSWPQRPFAIIVSGDLAYGWGQAEDYATFRNLIDPLRLLAPVHLLLGNHDDRENFWNMLPQDAQRNDFVPHKQVAIVSSPRADWFLLDSLDITNVTPGKIGTAQLAWLEQQITARQDQPAIVVCHHPVVPPPRGLLDESDVAGLLTRQRRIKAFVYGHTHFWQATEQDDGVQAINLPPTSYVFQPTWPMGWVRATLLPQGAEFELRSLDRKHPDHGQVKKVNWRAA